MKKLLQILYLSAGLIGVVPAHADTLTYLCLDHHKHYPVTLVTPDRDDCSGDITSCTITWRGTIWHNAKSVENCKENYIATNNGITINLCMATKGAAGLTVGDKSWECQMKP